MPAPELTFERRGSGPPLLLLHGIGCNLRIWDPVRPLLEGQFDVIAFDLPGHGGSPVPPPELASPHALALAVAVGLDRLGIETVHIAGNSLGGWISLELAKMGRARSVTAFSPAGLWRGRTPTYNIVTFRAFRVLACRLWSVFAHLAGNRITRTLFFSQFFGRPWLIPRAAAIEISNTFADAPGFDLILEASIPECFNEGQAIDVPISIAWGSRDVLLLPWQSRFRDELPAHTRWSTLKGCGHVPTYDDPRAVARLIFDNFGMAKQR